MRGRKKKERKKNYKLTAMDRSELSFASYNRTARGKLGHSHVEDGEMGDRKWRFSYVPGEVDRSAPKFYKG